LSQNLRLVQGRHRSRTIFSPQSQQKFGLYLVRSDNVLRVLSYYKRPALYPRLTKQPIAFRERPKSARLKNQDGAGILFGADFPMKYRFVFLMLLTIVAAATAIAQEVDDIVRTETSLVQLNIGVVDKQGRPIKSLTRNDFVVYEDGVKQSIQHFEPVDAPFSLVLMLDTSGSTVHFRQQLKLASQRFIDALAPEDRVAVIQFNAKVKSLAGFTTDRLKTAYAIEIADGAGDTNFYDALKYALKELEKEGQRRKAIVVLTDGLDTKMRSADGQTLSKATTDEEALTMIDPQSSPDLKSVLAAADRQGVTIFPLALPSGDPKRLPILTPKIVGSYAAARARLQSLADRTGGRLNEINKLQYMAHLYREVAANLRSLYTVAYQPQGDRVRGKWHEIKVEVANADLTARTKPGYFAR
jgi:VWFA-related protein